MTQSDDEYSLSSAPIPYANDEEAAPIPYLASALRTLRLYRPTSEVKDSGKDVDQEEEEGGDAEGEDIDEGGDDVGEDIDEDEREQIVAEHDEVQEKIIDGHDERIEVKPATSQPYRWICHLRFREGGKPYGGSGFLVNIPGSTTGCILTAGHNLWSKSKSYIKELEITFPGRDTIVLSEPPTSTTRQHYIVSPEYKKNFDKLHDYGIVMLPGYQGKGFGHSAVVTDDEIRAATAVVFGYPVDKPRKTMWGSGGKFLPPKPMQLHYTLDTTGGQSGSPVYIWLNGYWTIVGIHVLGSGSANSATRLTVEKMRVVLGWLKHPLQKVTLRTWDSDDRMVKIATRVQRFITAGSGDVKARFSADPYTDLMFIPLESPPQGLVIPDYRVKYAIASVRFNSTYLRMDGHQLFTDQTLKPNGGGVVNCQYRVGPLEMFHIKLDDDVPDMVNIESVKYPGVFLRMDGQYATATNLDGPPGSVNAQWTASDLERFKDFQTYNNPDNPDDDDPDVPDDDDDGSADLKKQIADLKQQLVDKDSTIAQLKAANSAANASLAQSQADLARAKADLLACQNAPVKTVTVQVPGPTQYVNVTTQVNVPGPTQYVNVPGPTQYVDRVVYRDDYRWPKARHEIAAYRSVAWSYHPLNEQVERNVNNGTYLPNSDIY